MAFAGVQSGTIRRIAAAKLAVLELEDVTGAATRSLGASQLEVTLDRGPEYLDAAATMGSDDEFLDQRGGDSRSMDHFAIGRRPRRAFECRTTVCDGVPEFEFDLVR